MIRLLIAGLMMLMAGNAIAARNETIFQDCKKYVEKGFETNTMRDLGCVAYFAGINDVLRDVCIQLNAGLGILNDTEKMFIENFAVGKDISLDAAIQHYVNKMQKTPEDWKYTAARDVKHSLQAIDTCKPE